MSYPYNRFVELEKEVLLPLTIFIKKILLGTCTGISFVDSTSLRICRNQCIQIHKSFKALPSTAKVLSVNVSILQTFCTSFAAALQTYCSNTAKALQ